MTDMVTGVSPRGKLWLPQTGALEHGEEYGFEHLNARLTIERGDFGSDDGDEVLIEAHVVYTDEPGEGEHDLMPVRLYMPVEQAAYLAGALTVATIGQEGLAENTRLVDAARRVAEELRHLARGKAAARRVPTEKLRAWASTLAGRPA